MSIFYTKIYYIENISKINGITDIIRVGLNKEVIDIESRVISENLNEHYIPLFQFFLKGQTIINSLFGTTDVTAIN